MKTAHLSGPATQAPSRGQLRNARHERFAQALAMGMSARQAYVEAGYIFHESNCIRLKKQPEVAARVAKILERLAVDGCSKQSKRGPGEVRIPKAFRTQARDGARSAGMPLSAYVGECVRFRAEQDRLREMIEAAAAAGAERAVRGMVRAILAAVE